MLNIDVKFVADELVPGLVNGEYGVESGTTVRELLAVCEARCGASIPEINFDLMYPLFKSRPVTLDSPLTDNGTLHLCRVIIGG